MATEIVDSVECSIAEYAVVTLRGGVECAVIAGDAGMEDIQRESEELSSSQGVEVVVLIAHPLSIALNGEGCKAGEVGSGGAGTDNAYELSVIRFSVRTVIGAAGDDTVRASTHVKGDVRSGAIGVVPRVDQVLVDR